MPGFFILTNLPHGATEEKVRNLLPAPLKRSLRQFWLHDDRRLAVLEADNATLVRAFVDDFPEMELGAGEGRTPSHLIVSLSVSLFLSFGSFEWGSRGICSRFSCSLKTSSAKK